MIEFKQCSICKINKDISAFRVKNKNNILSISKDCKDCLNLKMREWRLNNPEKSKAQNKTPGAKESKKKWLLKNKDKRAAYEKQYYLDNIEQFKINSQSEKCKETKRLYKKNRRNNDPIFRMRGNISNAIYRALIKGKSNKAGQSILQYLDYTIDILKIHLENKFDDKMSWDNYGSYWHIDHIIPHSTFNYISMKDQSFKECWALSNLRPLDAKQNMSDGATRIRHNLI